MLRTVLSLALLSLVATNAYPQEPKLNPILPNPRVRESYDRFNDSTSVALDIELINEVMNLGGGSIYVRPGSVPRRLIVTVLGTVPGKSLIAPNTVALIIHSRSEDWRYLRPPVMLQVIINGEVRGTLGELKRVNSEVLRGSGSVMEQLTLDLPFAVIQRLAAAKRLEMRVGLDEVEVKSDQILDLRDWVSKFRTKPATVDH